VANRQSAVRGPRVENFGRTRDEVMEKGEKGGREREKERKLPPGDK